MQIVVAYSGDQDGYARENAHFLIARPQTCPNCGMSGVLRALGYYSRWVSSAYKARMISIRVRRFRCPVCHLTTSMLPDFAQPYRLIATDAVDGFLSGSREGEMVEEWNGLLRSYQRRFELRLPSTRDLLATIYGLSHVSRSTRDAWKEICHHFESARALTLRLVDEARITVFGIYRCHHPAGKINVHTSLQFTFQRSPPLS